MDLITRVNHALDVNPSTGANHVISEGGDNWLWTVAAVYLFSFLVVAGLSFIAPHREKIFHYLFTISLFTGAIAYFCAASNLGWTPIVTSSDESGTRQIYYSKYINWFVGWTPMIASLGVISGVSWATTLYNIALMWIWVCTWLAGAMVTTRYKWGFFAFGTFAYFMLAFSIVLHGRRPANRIGVGKHYTALSVWLCAVWFAYPIAWGLDDGGNRYHVTRAWIFWGILDIFTVPFLSFVILSMSRSWDYDRMNIYFTQYGRIQEGTDLPEKGHPDGVHVTPAHPHNSLPPHSLPNQTA